MTVFIEPFRKPHEHMMVVQSLLLLESKRDEKLYFVSTKDYFDSIPDHCKNNVILIDIVNDNFSGLSMIVKIFYLVLKYNCKLRPNRIILLSTKSYSSLLIKIWTLFTFNRTNIYVLLHGELQYLIINDTLRKKYDAFINKLVFRINSHFNTSFKFVILSNLVFENLCKHLRYDLKNIIHLDLPYDYTDLKNIKNTSLVNSKLIISTIGVNSKEKNSHFINILADNLHNQITNNLLEIRCIGRIQNIELRNTISFLDLKGAYFIDPNSYAKLILESSFILSFVDDSNYSLISSGSYFDCIKYQKPILALRNSQWLYNFEKFGEIGILFNSVNEMAQYILSIIDKSEEAFKFNTNLKEALLLTGINNNLTNYKSLLK